MVVVAYVVPVAVWLAGGLSAWLLLTFASFPLVPPLVRTVSTRSDGPSLNGALAHTGRLVAVFSLLLAAGELLS
jgi:1,4-dihydroxy-2-naphthoate octaprenyltransferase